MPIIRRKLWNYWTKWWPGIGQIAPQDIKNILDARKYCEKIDKIYFILKKNNSNENLKEWESIDFKNILNELSSIKKI